MIRPIALALALGLALIDPVLSAANESASSLRFRLNGEPVTLDWNLARSSHETYIIMNVMEGLVEESADLKPAPALAEGWTLSQDARTYTFKIKSGVKWTDGRELVAQDFVNSWLRLMDPKTKSAYAGFLDAIAGAREFRTGKGKRESVGVKALSDTELQVVLKEPVPQFPHYLTFWVTFPIRADLIKKHGSKWTDPTKLVTLGAYRIKEWRRGESIELVSNLAYSGARKPSVDRAIGVVETDDRRARVKFEKGELDFLLDATTSDILSGGGGKWRVQQFPYLVTYYLGFKTTHPALRAPEIRQAIASVIDVSKIPSLLQGGQSSARSLIPPGISPTGARLDSRLNLSSARKVLAAAGFPEGRGFARLNLQVERFDGADALGGEIAREIREKLGIEVQHRVSDPKEYQSAIKSDSAAMYLGHWGADYPDAINFLEVFKSDSGTNSTGWNNARYDQWISDASRSADPKERQLKLAMAEELLISQESVVLPLFYRKNTVLLGQKIKEFRISPLNYLFLKDVSLAKVN